jgi:hypothetical protein
MPIPADPAMLALVASLADDPSGGPPAAPEEAPFRLVLELDAWRPRLAGDFTDGGGKVDVDAPDLHGAETAFAGSIAARRDRLEVSVRGFAFSTDGGGVANDTFTLGGATVAAGDAFTSEFSWWSAGAAVAYDAWRPLEERPSTRAGTDFSIFLLGSADIAGLSRTVVDSTTATATDADESLLALALGGGFRVAFDTPDSLPLVRRAAIEGSASYGLAIPVSGGDLGTAVRIEASLRAWFCDEGSVRFGYRLVGVDLDGEDMSLAGSLQGLFLGVGIEF